MPEKTETRCKVKRCKIVIIGIGRIKCRHRGKPHLQPRVNENILN